MSGKSEVAHLREQMEAECQAMQRVMNAPAITANHRAIMSRYRRLGQYASRLEQHVGKEEATNMLGDIYASILK